jgi:hypothetical protein
MRLMIRWLITFTLAVMSCLRRMALRRVPLRVEGIGKWRVLWVVLIMWVI